MTSFNCLALILKMLQIIIIFIFFAFSSFLKADSAWVVGPEELLFINSQNQTSSVTQHSVQSSLVDPRTCHLWIQTGQEFLELTPSLKVMKRIESSDRILGYKLKGDLWISLNNGIWDVRTFDGQIQSRLPAPIENPVDLELIDSKDFWTLSFNEQDKRLELVSFNSQGNILSSHLISSKAELWHRPYLLRNPHSEELWVGYTMGTATHAYSPKIERWSLRGKKLNEHLFPHRGLLLGIATSPNNSILLARDIPSSPFTVPLFTFIDEINPFFQFATLFSLEDNYIIRSLDSEDRWIWSYETSILGSTEKRIVKRDFYSGQEKVFTVKDAPWKIHACSLQ